MGLLLPLQAADGEQFNPVFIRVDPDRVLLPPSIAFDYFVHLDCTLIFPHRGDGDSETHAVKLHTGQRMHSGDRAGLECIFIAPLQKFGRGDKPL